MITKDQVSEIIKTASPLGALGEEGEPIGDCLAKMWRAWRHPDHEIAVADELGDWLEAALKELDACYSEDGYELDAPRAHDALWPVCDAIDAITAAIYAESERRDAEEEDAA